MAGNISPNTILLKGGTILQHDGDDEVRILRDTDLLIEEDQISKIGKSLAVNPAARIIDCRRKVVSPGFVDTHHHVWQTQLKGRHSDDTLLDYTAKGMSNSSAAVSKSIQTKALMTQHWLTLSLVVQEIGNRSITPQATSSGASWEACWNPPMEEQLASLIMRIWHILPAMVSS